MFFEKRLLLTQQKIFSGHGPFSHVFDGQFMKKLKENNGWTVTTFMYLFFDMIL